MAKGYSVSICNAGVSTLTPFHFVEALKFHFRYICHNKEFQAEITKASFLLHSLLPVQITCYCYYLFL